MVFKSAISKNEKAEKKIYSKGDCLENPFRKYLQARQIKSISQ